MTPTRRSPRRSNRPGATPAWDAGWKSKRRSTLLCFEDKENDVWLFVAGRAAVKDAPDSAEPQFWQRDHLSSAVWTRGDKLYLLVAPGDGAALRRYL